MMHTTLPARVRPAALADSFYAADPLTLMQQVDQQLAQARELVATQLASHTLRPKILIAPHAGHVYSGLAASIAYARLAPHIQSIRRIVLLCPAHREYFQGVALPGASAFATPLGTLSVDPLGAAVIADLPFVTEYAKAHEQEHAIEVHLPFIQRLWSALSPAQQPTIVPLVVGDIASEQVEQLIERLWGNTQTLILISTDLSHFQPYDQASLLDSATCEKITSMQGAITHHEACGATPLNAALYLARSKGLQIERLVYCNSGDTGGNTPEGRERVVGYASFALYETPPSQAQQGLQGDQGLALTQLARASLHHATGAAPMPTPQQQPWLEQLGACFVTLSSQGQLRGCIGSLLAYRRLQDDVIANAAAAALHDQRFPPVTAPEAPDIAIEVSVLTQPSLLDFANEGHALWQLEPLRDGVIFSANVLDTSYRSTFLPQVWGQLNEPQQFMAQLKIKAGLTADFWSDNVRLETYRVQEFHEPAAVHDAIRSQAAG